MKEKKIFVCSDFIKSGFFLRIYELPEQSFRFPEETHTITQSEVTLVLLSVKFCSWNSLALVVLLLLCHFFF